MQWKLCHPRLGLKDKLQMETFATRHFRARFYIIRSPHHLATGYILRNHCIASRTMDPGARFELFHLHKLVYKIQCSKLGFLTPLR